MGLFSYGDNSCIRTNYVLVYRSNSLSNKVWISLNWLRKSLARESPAQTTTLAKDNAHYSDFVSMKPNMKYPPNDLATQLATGEIEQETEARIDAEEDFSSSNDED